MIAKDGTPSTQQTTSTIGGYRPRNPTHAGVSKMRPLEVLYEDNHLIAVNKPAGVATMGAVKGQPSMVEQVKHYIKHHYQKPGNVYLGVVSRLDSPVTGVVLFARTSKAAARLNVMFRTRAVKKTYWALLAPARLDSTGTLEHWLVKNEARRRMVVSRAGQSGAKRALLHYRVCHRQREQALVQIKLQTGRKHQIRVQFEAIGCPIMGDAKYGSRVGFPDGIALHARELVCDHPVRESTLELTAGLPRAWPVAEDAFLG